MASVHHSFECKRSPTNKYPIAEVYVIYALKIYYQKKSNESNKQSNMVCVVTGAGARFWLM